MIELRWLVKETPILRYEDGNPSAVIEENVLQYRFWMAYAAANGNAMFPLQPEWSDWKDVPVEREAGK